MGRVISWATFVFASAVLAATPVRLDWQAPEGCPTADQVLLRITSQLVPSLQQEAPLEVTAKASQVSGQWRLDMDVKDARGTGQRTLHADSCDALADAAALVVAITLNPSATVEAAPVEEKAAPPPEVARSAESEKPSDPLGWAIRGGATADLSTWPLILWGGVLHGAIELGRVRIEVAAGGLGTRRFSGGPRVDSSVDIAMPLFGGLKGCFLPVKGAIQVATCAGAEAGWVIAQGNGVDQPRRGQSVWWALEVETTLRLKLYRNVHAHLGANLAYSPAQTSIFFDGFGEVARSRALTFRPELGLELAWK